MLFWRKIVYLRFEFSRPFNNTSVASINFWKWNRFISESSLFKSRNPRPKKYFIDRFKLSMALVENWNFLKWNVKDDRWCLPPVTHFNFNFSSVINPLHMFYSPGSLDETSQMRDGAWTTKWSLDWAKSNQHLGLLCGGQNSGVTSVWKPSSVPMNDVDFPFTICLYEW